MFLISCANLLCLSYVKRDGAALFYLVAPLKNVDYLNENADADKHIVGKFDDDDDVEPDVAIYVALSCMLGIYMILTSITIMAALFCYDCPDCRDSVYFMLMGMSDFSQKELRIF
ncbi:hypothetical protein D918_00380 [Trichuris suis]|nr:hypothetical protein D918_00380 [Trichuris suis]